jgi:outer membrane biogenesis lipoprotein LolB
MVRALLLLLAAASPACGSPDEPVRDAQPTASPVPARQLGSWTGTGSTTLGFVSESGSFRITWNARNQDAAHPGTFQLTLRSGISGRPLKVVADHEGAGAGSVEFGDDPRMYEFLVESRGIDWSVSVDETFAPQPPP